MTPTTSPLQVCIRDATPADLDALLACDPLAMQRLQWLHHALDSGSVFLAQVVSQVVGFAVLEHTFFGHGFVSLVAVAPDQRRRGGATSLLRAARTRCRTHKLFTSTNQSNLAAQALFDRVGFAPSGSIFNLDPGDPEVVYFMDVAAAAESVCPASASDQE